jgi:hypothetical protein
MSGIYMLFGDSVIFFNLLTESLICRIGIRAKIVTP